MPTSKSEKGSAESWRDMTLAKLSEAGYRRGGSRQKVVDLLDGETCAITAMEIDVRLKDVGRATVYRNLNQLEELSLVQRVDLGVDSVAYEKVDSVGHHHHIVCSNCTKVIPFEDARLEKAIHSITEKDGFQIESHEVTLRGICHDCA